MPLRIRTPSIIRPRRLVDEHLARNECAPIRDVSRRGILRGALGLGATTLLAGCDVSEIDDVQKGLRTVSAWNDGVQETIFRPQHLAPTFTVDQVVKPPRFNAYYDIEDLKPVDGATWKLELMGRVADRRPWTMQQIYELPEQEVIIRHVCVEGWDYIGQWSGPNLRAFLEKVGADLTARYVYFICSDNYTESVDMACALHPQTILATKYAKEALADPFGFPLRLRTAVKLGYKNAKWIKAIEVTNDFRETFWSKQGFNWFAGI
jgi:DMSO/TMAO reductase YedYZ molybdopterin-dependent catalytic subunit